MLRDVPLLSWPGICSTFRCTEHKSPGICSIFRRTEHNNPGICSTFRCTEQNIFKIKTSGTAFTQHSQQEYSRPDPCSVDFAKLPNSDLNFAVDFWVDFSSCFSKEKGPQKSTAKNPLQNSPGNSVGKIPLGFLQKPFLEKYDSDGPILVCRFISEKLEKAGTVDFKT